MHRVLYSALNQAERWKLILRNPAALVDSARRKPAALCGLRRGEITALRWRSIDLDRGQLAVVASTEQTDAGVIREKEAKSGPGPNRRPALPCCRGIAPLAAYTGPGTAKAWRQG
jgi:integrase